MKQDDVSGEKMVQNRKVKALSALFDDHYEAFPLWRENGLMGLTCLHVDAHLDVMEDGFTPQTLAAIAGATTRAELERFRGDPNLPWGGFHCGNYLFPALLDGTITTLIWLLPREVITSSSLLDGVRQELQNWVDLSLEEYSGFRYVDGYIEGRLRGCRMVVCTSESLPPLSEQERSNLALDIDVDYFIRLKDDTIWQTPHQLYDALGPLQPVALTVALSCEGGYTPVGLRYLGQVCLDVFSGQPEKWRAELEAMVAAQRQGEQAWQALLETAPLEWKPAVLSQLGRQQEAAALDPEYGEKALNLASRCLQKKQFEQGLRILTESDDPDATRYFLTAFLTAGSADPKVTEEQLEVLLQKPGISDLERSRLWRMQAEMLAKSGQPKKAVPVLKKALKVEPQRADAHYLLAMSLRAAGERDAAARSLRKALKLSRGKISSLQMLLDAARLYEEMGQTALARAARRELQDSDVTGYYAIESILERSRL